MATVVRMPSALAGSSEAAIQTWLAEVGQTIAVGDPFAEIETEKAVVEYAAEVGGTVGKLLAEPGKSIEVGTPIAVILALGDGEDAIEAALAEAGFATFAATATAAPDPTIAMKPAPPEPGSAPETIASTAPAASVIELQGQRVQHGDRRFASPLVRRLVRERGIELIALIGTGPGGRIVRRDLDGLPASAVPTAKVLTPPASAIGGYTDVPLTGMRRAIARRLTESKTTVPHFYVTAHCRVDALLELRRQVNESSERKISVNDFVLKAVARALVRVPAANAIWMGDSIRRFDGVDLAVAVAVDGGLLTPVVRGVDELSLGAVAAAVAELVTRARAGQLKQHELEGGSFSVSNLGMYGVDEFSAILNPPQSGILAVGAAKPRALVDKGNVIVGTVMTVTLSADHRVLDGSVAAEWMAALVALLENPVGILI